jgi:hypothetical protein
MALVFEREVFALGQSKAFGEQALQTEERAGWRLS